MLLGIPGTYDDLSNEHFDYPKLSDDESRQGLDSIGIIFKSQPDSQALDFASARQPCLAQLD